ncbi:MAG: glutamine synthetase [Planctomycetes bacterium]|nr:glutamine synthetase [Planctomycetota bacterium]
MEEVTKDKEYVLREVMERNVKFIRFWFTDVLGSLKSFAITADELEGALEDGMGFDGSSIEGYARIEESDMVAMPDPSTFTLLPWRPTENGAVARMFCDVLEPDGSPYDGDPRRVLRRNLERASDMGYDFYVGPELEFFYFEDCEGTEQLDAGGYFDLTPLDIASDLRRDTILALEKMDIPVEYSHHEVAPSQHEIDLRYCEALRMADAAMTYRLTVKEVALQHEVYATFMPKPLFGENGSGMHTHMSLFDDNGQNAFFDKGSEYCLSGVGKSFIAGLLMHAREISSVVAQWVNSYKRLVPGYEAPVYVSWARRNRSALVRVPMYKPGNEKATRAEFRCPDPACNPYLAFSVMLAAGLKGIEEGYELPDPVEEDIFEMSPSERESVGITSLPGNLGEAIAETQKSELVREALGEHVFQKFIENKKIEWDRYRTHVSQYELEEYLPIL